MVKQKLRMGMIGGGRKSFIGAVHRIAALMDGYIELSCAALSADPAVAKASGEDLLLPNHRNYTSYNEMILAEKALPEHERIHFVSIVTPNHVHFEPAIMALENGFHVVIDKPITLTLAEAKALHQKANQTGLMVCLTHTYSGYPMVKQAKKMFANGMFGKVRKVCVEYPQGWLSKPAAADNKQASWRADPAKSGISGCMADVGTHAAHLAEYISGLKITQLCADLNIVVDGNVLLKFNNGANGTLMAAQIAAGEENALKIKVYGEKGGIEWHQMDPNNLIVKWLNQPMQIYRTGNAYVDEIAKFNTRTPAGHPEGYLEAFANLYKNFALALDAKLNGLNPSAEMLDFPSTEEGVRGMAFLENVVASGKSNQKWFDHKID